MKRSLLQHIRNSNDPSLGAALIRMANQGVAVHRFEVVAGGSFQHPTRGGATDGATPAHRLNPLDTDPGHDVTGESWGGDR